MVSKTQNGYAPIFKFIYESWSFTRRPAYSVVVHATEMGVAGSTPAEFADIPLLDARRIFDCSTCVLRDGKTPSRSLSPGIVTGCPANDEHRRFAWCVDCNNVHEKHDLKGEFLFEV